MYISLLLLLLSGLRGANTRYPPGPSSQVPPFPFPSHHPPSQIPSPSPHAPSPTPHSLATSLSPPSAVNISSFIPSISNLALEIFQSLADAPTGFGPRCSDRQSWNLKANASDSTWKYFILSANSSILLPFNADAYLAYVRSGSRISDALTGNRLTYLSNVVLAECIEWKGQFLKRISDALVSLATQPSWTFSAHDPLLTYFNGTKYFVELGGAAYAPVLAQTLYLLGPLVNASTQKIVHDALEARFLSPARLAYNLTASQFMNGNNWWVNSLSPNNWNAVCLGGVTATALTLLQDKADRAVFVAGQIVYSAFFSTFAPDGYFTEGVGYWNYAVQYAIRSREIILQSTSGKIDIFNSSQVARAVLYGLNFPMTSSQSPCSNCRASNANFGDDGSHFTPGVIGYMSNIFLSTNITLTSPIINDVSGQSMTWWPYDGGRKLSIPGVQSKGVYSIRTFFSSAGVLISRPDANNSASGLYFTAKALGDATLNASGGHSHNDVGSYAINIDGATNLTGDPGSPGAYDSDTFTSARWTQPIFNSYGHPVPLVALQNQTNAALAQHQPATHTVPSFIFATDGNTSETLTINLTAAYPTSPSLKSLFRTFVYMRESSSVQYVTVNDTAVFSQPEPMEVALVTLVNWTSYVDGSGGCFSGSARNATLCANISASSPFSLSARLLSVKANPSKTFTRIAISLTCGPSCWVHTLFYNKAKPPAGSGTKTL